MRKPEYIPFPLKTCLQCTLADRRDLPDFEQLLRVLRDEGFYGIELNLPDLYIIPSEELTLLLQKYDLKMDMLATGAYARKHGLSLSDPDEGGRKAAVEGCKRNIDYAEAMGCGLIIGFLKGGPNQDADAQKRLIRSLSELAPYLEKCGVTTLLEATNHTESSIACTLDETLAILKQVDSPYVKLLADTYHMNIEEPPVLQSLYTHAGAFGHLHISDDNRAFPGLGSLDFASFYQALYEIGYKGGVAIEGNILTTQIADTVSSAGYLHKACKHAFLPVEVKHG